MTTERDTPPADAPTREDGLSDEALICAAYADVHGKRPDFPLVNEGVMRALILRIRSGHAARGDEARDSARLNWLANALRDCSVNNADPSLFDDDCGDWPTYWRLAIDAAIAAMTKREGT